MLVPVLLQEVDQAVLATVTALVQPFASSLLALAAVMDSALQSLQPVLAVNLLLFVAVTVLPIKVNVLLDHM